MHIPERTGAAKGPAASSATQVKLWAGLGGWFSQTFRIEISVIGLRGASQRGKGLGRLGEALGGRISGRYNKNGGQEGALSARDEWCHVPHTLRVSHPLLGSLDSLPSTRGQG